MFFCIMWVFFSFFFFFWRKRDKMWIFWPETLLPRLCCVSGHHAKQLAWAPFQLRSSVWDFLTRRQTVEHSNPLILFHCEFFWWGLRAEGTGRTKTLVRTKQKNVQLRFYLLFLRWKLLQRYTWCCSPLLPLPLRTACRVCKYISKGNAFINPAKREQIFAWTFQLRLTSIKRKSQKRKEQPAWAEMG